MSLLNLHSVELNFNYSACEGTGYTCLINEIFIIVRLAWVTGEFCTGRAKMEVYKTIQKLHYSDHSLGSLTRIILTFMKKKFTKMNKKDFYFSLPPSLKS